MPDLSALALQAAAKTRAVSGRVHDHAVVTPLIGLAAASQKSGTEILLKCEHQQTTGSEVPGTAAWTGSAIPDAAVPVAGGDDRP